MGVADGGIFFLQNPQARWGEGGCLYANCSQICPAPSDGDSVVSVRVSKVCTRTLVSIGYDAFMEDDFSREVILLLKIILFALSINFSNQDRESLHKIRRNHLFLLPTS